MPRLTWGNNGERYYETGVDRGVLYLAAQPAVAWNGLTAINEEPDGGTPKPYYLDGEKYLNVSTAEEFGATLEAYSSPREFAPCEGVAPIQNGLFVSQQPRRAFGLCYRTGIGNDIDGSEHGYKLHLVYNALAGPASRSNATRSESPEPATLSWSITTLPPSLTGFKPTAHFVIDSRFTPRGLLAAIEDILYGSDVLGDGRLPEPSELLPLFQSQGPVTRQNICVNPAMRWLTGAAGSTPMYVQGASNVTSAVINGRTWLQSTSSPYLYAYAPVTPGSNNYYAASFLAMGTPGTAFNAYTSDNLVGAFTETKVVTIPASGEIRIFLASSTVPAPATNTLSVGIGSNASNVKMTEALIEVVSGPGIQPGSYFDGSMEDANNNFYSWAGVADQSVSILNSWN